MISWLRAVLALMLASTALLAVDWLLKLEKPPVSGQKTWRLALTQYVHAPECEDAEAGFREGLKDSGLIEGRDYETVVRNANGDMSTLPIMIDAALSGGADILVTFSTPTLQTALSKNIRVPIVFTFVADPIAAGAGKDYDDHLANITGVYTHHACAELIASIRKCIPGVKRIGTLFIPAEVNSVFNRDMLVDAANKAKIEVLALPIATASDLPDAAAALCSRNIDAVAIVGGNLTIAGYPTIATAARRARLPSFGTVHSQYEAGAVLVVAREYRDSGRLAGKIAARVIRGENPTDIPFQPTTTTRLFVNPEAARQCGLKIPKSLIDSAVEVKND